MKSKTTTSLLKHLAEMNTSASRLVEYDDDDELSASERALIAKADKDLSARGVKVKNFNPEKMVGKPRSAASSEEGDDATPPSKKSVASDSEKPAADDQSKQPRVRGDKAQAAKKYISDNPSAKRKEFAAFMAGYDVSPAYANTMFYALKKRLSEVYYITNSNNQVLAEGDIWTEFDNYSTRLLMFKHQWNAQSRTLKTGGVVNRQVV